MAIEQAFQIDQGKGDDDVAAMCALFVEYQAWLNEDLCFQDFEAELAGLPGPYVPPEGVMLFARRGEDVAGGVAVKPLPMEGGVACCEMKRLYVRPAYRGLGLGRRLAAESISFARTAGYDRMCLDTLERLDAARTLYRDLGFRDVPAYYDNPLESPLFMALDLNAAVSPTA